MKMKKSHQGFLRAAIGLFGIVCVTQRPTEGAWLRGHWPTTAPASQTAKTDNVPIDPCTDPASTARTHTSPLERCKALYSQARCILVIQCAPLLSKGLMTDQDWDSELTRLAERAIATLHALTEAMPKAKTGQNEDPSDWESHIEVLLEFGRIFAALGKDPEKSETKEALMEACNALAPYLDDNDAGLVESVRLWQAVAYRRVGRGDRALQILRPALAPPSSPRIGIWSRIERCRALADRGENAAAISLALQLMARVGSWFGNDTPETRTQASQTIDQLRGDLYQQWADRLRADGKASQADSASRQAEELRRKSNPPNQLPLLESIAGIPDPNLDVNGKHQTSGDEKP